MKFDLDEVLEENVQLEAKNKELREALNMIIATYDMPNTVRGIAKEALMQPPDKEIGKNNE